MNALTGRLYCRVCRRQRPVSPLAPDDLFSSPWVCGICGAPILCQQCGAEWSYAHGDSCSPG